jgi:hypothetical protein
MKRKEASMIDMVPLLQTTLLVMGSATLLMARVLPSPSMASRLISTLDAQIPLTVKTELL